MRGANLEIIIKANPKEIAELLVEVEARLGKTIQLPQNLLGGVVVLDSSAVQQLIKDSAVKYAELNEQMNRQGEFRRE